MNYFEAASIYQDFAISLQYAELEGKTHEEAMRETAAKYTSNQIDDCLEALLNDLDKKGAHYASLFKIIAGIKRASGEKPDIKDGE
jgi:hypothetical protein